ncbi:hypothetical protein BSKO_08265 [Bryopsis sp. KO-2023]|nr:hypothetical protein BSKO_08265 [Bryopsis sp. KO-2023]
MVDALPQEDAVVRLKEKLLGGDLDLPSKYRVLFSLRNVPGRPAQEALEAGLGDTSTLFRHDVAFCLGQRQDPNAVKILSKILGDASEHSMVRHEAGEALGAIGTPDCKEILESFSTDSAREVSETCCLALQRIAYYRDRGEADSTASTPKSTLSERGSEFSPYLSVDPTPAASMALSTDTLAATLSDESAKMFDRYAALFALRNRGGSEAVSAIGKAFSSGSALLKHELAYVLGQMQDPEATQHLVSVLKDQGEHAMVRHEAAEALGSIADEGSVQLLKEFSKDPEPIVAESCIVALDTLQYNNSEDFQYADLGKPKA